MADTMINVSAAQLKDELKDCITLRETALVVGPPGIGKTEITKQVAESLGYDLLITHPVVDESIDYKGMPAIIDGEDGKEGAFLPFGHLKRQIDAKEPLVVLIDDVGQAQRMVQAAIMQLVLEGAINGVPISDKVTYILCSNRAGDRAGADGGVLEPLKSRSVIYQLASDVDDWIKWALTSKEDGGGGMPPVLCAFMRFQPDSLNDFTPTRDMVNSPNPRCWERLGKFYNAGVGTMAKYAGCVGDGTAAKWQAFEKTWSKLPKIENILMNPEKAPVPEELDVLYALSGALAHHAKPACMDGLYKYINRMPKEFQVTTVKDMIVRKENLATTNAFQNWVADNKAVTFG